MKESERPNFYSLQAGLLCKAHSWGYGVPHPQIVKDSREGHISFFLTVGLAAYFNDCIHFEYMLDLFKPLITDYLACFIKIYVYMCVHYFFHVFLTCYFSGLGKCSICWF